MNDVERTVPLLPGERVDDLMAGGLAIIQHPGVFCFSLDAVLLARFVTLPPRGRVVDLCTGNGIIPLLLSTRTAAEIVGVEIQERLCDMARRSVTLNGLNDRVSILCRDLRMCTEVLPVGTFDVVTANPPYLPRDGADVSPNPYLAAARHELFCTLEDVVRVASRLVKSGGRVALVHRPARLVELFSLMRQYRVEPKRVRLVHPYADRPANLVLVEGIRDGGVELRVMPPLVVYRAPGVYTDEVLRIYGGGTA